MFEFIRTHKRWLQILLALLIIPSFVLVGVGSYGGGSGPEVAIVDNKPITQPEWDEAQRQQMERYRGMLGAQFDQKMFDTPEAKQDALERLVTERSIEAEINRAHLTLSDASLQEKILEEPSFRKEDGKFDLEVYKSRLAAANMTPAMYDARLRRDATLQQLNGAVQNSAFMPRSLATRLSDTLDQEREVQELLFPATEYLAQVKVTDEMVKAFYDKNTTLFQIPERVKLEYVQFDAAVVDSLVTVADSEVTAAYDAGKANYTSQEQRFVSHILIKAGADKAAAKAKADAVLAEVRKDPANFAAVAKAQSQDVSTAEQGGDLGMVEKGSLPSASVEAAALKLKQGEVSDVVSSDAGFHILTVTKLTPSVVRPFDDVKTEIAAELKRQKMSKKYTELAEQFSNMVSDQAESLKPAADKLKLKIETVDNVTRTPNPTLGDAPYNNPKFLTALFTDETLKNKRNTEAVQVAPTTLLAGRVVEYKPAAKRPLAEVDAIIRQRVAQEEAAKLAKKAGEVKMAAAKASNDAAGFGEPKIVARNKQPPIQPAAAKEVMKADATKLPAYVGVDVPGVGYAVYRINKVTQPAQPDVARRAAEQEQLNTVLGQQETFGYIEVLRHKSKAKLLVKPSAVAAADGKTTAPQ